MSVEAGIEEQVMFGELQLPFNHSYLRGEIFPPFVTEQKLSENNTLELRDDDIFVATFPKSGTTWTQKILHSLHEVHNTGKYILLLSYFMRIKNNATRKAVKTIILTFRLASSNHYQLKNGRRHKPKLTMLLQ